MTMELIKVTTDAQGEQLVSGRELHEFLEVGTAYKDWFPRMVAYGFDEGKDFSSFLSRSTGGRPSVDHAMKLDMAKEISMIQRTAKGKQARQYFIEVEKQFKQQAPNFGSLEGVVTSVISYIKDAVLAEVRQEMTDVTERAFQSAAEPLKDVSASVTYENITSSALAEKLGFSGGGKSGAAKLNKALAEIGILKKTHDSYGNACWELAGKWASRDMAVVSYYKGRRPWLRWTPSGVSAIEQLVDMDVLKLA